MSNAHKGGCGGARAPPPPLLHDVIIIISSILFHHASRGGRKRTGKPLPLFNSETMKRGLYGIVDLLASDVIGNPMLFNAEAQALRFFGDVLRMENSQVAKHPADHAMVRYGWLEHNRLEPDYAVIMTGAQWVAAATPRLVQEEAANG